MKYGRLVYKYNSKFNNGGVYGIGDNIQTFAIDNAYSIMGIPKEDIIDINCCDMALYDGEYVVVPICCCGSHYKRFNMFPCSHKIIPVFFGFEMSDEACDDIIPYLKQFEPIGCRDEMTMQLLRRKGVQAYTIGCITITLPRRREEPGEGKVFIVDVSEKLKPYIPESLLKDANIVSHEFPIKEGCVSDDDVIRINNLAWDTLEKYRKEAKLVITSRLHAAAPCLAMGIPVILAIDNIDSRFSWLDKLIPLYDVGSYNKIDWNPNPISIDFETHKERMIDLFCKMVSSAHEKYSGLSDISYYWEKRNKVKYNATLYKKLSILEKKYNDKSLFEYIIWGAGVHGKLAYSVMQELFPMARLVAYVDNNATGVLNGVSIIKPNESVDYKFDIALITTHPGRLEAVEILEKRNMKYAEDYIYFISKDVPEENIERHDW